MKLKIKLISFIILIIIIFSTLNAQGLILSNNNNNKIEKNQQNPLISLSDLIYQVNRSTLEKYIKDIQSFGSHSTGSTSIEKVKIYLYNELIKMPIHVEYHQWSFEDKNGENIIATIPGKVSSNNIIMVCAHYDTIEVSPGADDDGSGVAAILMMSIILSQYTFNNTIKLILFSGEEQGLLGSKEYVKKIEEQGNNVIGILALDKIGYAKTSEQGKIIRHHADPSSSWMIDITEEIADKFKKEINLNIRRLPFDSSSDHKAFVDKGYSGSNLAEEALNPYYHTSEDLLKHMNLTYLKKVCQLATCTIASIASGNSNLTNNDIEISILGKNNNPYQAKLTIGIKNKKYNIDTANLSITIQMHHIIRDKLVKIKKEYYQIPCIWYFTEEIQQNWYFNIGQQTYTTGLFIVTIYIHGLKDDILISKTESKFGLIFPEHNLIIF